MKKATINRDESDEDGTFGSFSAEGGADGKGFKCRIAELPWRNNENGKSCIPKGTYLFKWRTDSPKHGACYEEWDDPSTPKKEDVPGRTNVQIHAANWPEQLLGCLAPGAQVAYISPGPGMPAKKGVTSSKATLKALEDFFNRETFELTITGVCG